VPTKQNSGKCATCGFLCKSTAIFRYPKFYEIGEGERDGWKLQNPRDELADGIGKVSYQVFCFRGVIKLDHKEAFHPDDTVPPPQVVSEIERERQCPQWASHKNGLGPLRQWDEMRLEMIEKGNRQLTLKLWVGATILGIAQIVTGVLVGYIASRKPLVIKLELTTTEPVSAKIIQPGQSSD
jgi:hypothetical protein